MSDSDKPDESQHDAIGASRRYLSSNKRVKSPTRRLVSRLIGFETEYATLVADNAEIASDQLPASQEIYVQICEAIRRDQPTVAGIYDSEQMFLASGGAVTFESHPTLHSLPGGLIEIATPEVRSPEELLACQRSIDELVAEAARNIDLDVDLRILKNSSDALGHVYGCQENYETAVASGIWLLIYRTCVCMLWGLQVVSLIASLPVLAIVVAVVFTAKALRGGWRDFSPDSAEVFEQIPDWMSGLVIAVLRLVHLPTVTLLRFVARHIAFRPQRKYLTAFLVSRVALCGSGDLDHEGCFRTSAKAMAIDQVADMGGFRGERPIFVYGHWLGQFCAKSFLSLSSTARMLRRKQRLQIGLSDSNMSELAEYVKVGSVSLLLDMIEAGAVHGLPTMKRPVDSLHRMTRDWNLVSRAPTSSGELSALEIQRKYLKAAEEFLQETPSNYRGEAPVVIRRWRELYECVIAFRRRAEDTEPAIGKVDWLTKHWLMDQLGSKSEWAAKKKIDLRYHELSPDGYFTKIVGQSEELRLVDDEQIDRRRRSPPPSSPAARRGWLIREFAGSEESMQSDWSHAMIGRGRSRKRIEFLDPSTSE